MNWNVLHNCTLLYTSVCILFCFQFFFLFSTFSNLSGSVLLYLYTIKLSQQLVYPFMIHKPPFSHTWLHSLLLIFLLSCCILFYFFSFSILNVSLHLPFSLLILIPCMKPQTFLVAPYTVILWISQTHHYILCLPTVPC